MRAGEDSREQAASRGFREHKVQVRRALAVCILILAASIFPTCSREDAAGHERVPEVAAASAISSLIFLPVVHGAGLPRRTDPNQETISNTRCRFRSGRRSVAA